MSPSGRRQCSNDCLHSPKAPCVQGSCDLVLTEDDFLAAVAQEDTEKMVAMLRVRIDRQSEPGEQPFVSKTGLNALLNGIIAGH
jgi:hypothetical protein